MTLSINQEVHVNAVYFAGAELRTFPREIEYNGQAVTFLDGLRYLVQRGSEAVRVFDMNAADGKTYRLRQDGTRWTLLGLRREELIV